MNINIGELCFIKDDFFELVNDPYLKKNYLSSQRPHYFAVRDIETSLIWMIPISSKVEKFKEIINSKRLNHKRTDGIKIVKIFGEEQVMLFQDMFPICDKYINNIYIKGGQVVRIADPNKIREIEKQAKKVIKLFRLGIKFTPTQPDVVRIENIMLSEID